MGHRGNNYNIYIENLVQVYVGPVLVVSVSMNSHAKLTQTVLLYWCPLSSLALRIVPSPLTWGFLSSEGRDLREVSHLDAPHIMSVTICCQRKTLMITE